MRLLTVCAASMHRGSRLTDALCDPTCKFICLLQAADKIKDAANQTKGAVKGEASFCLIA